MNPVYKLFSALLVLGLAFVPACVAQDEGSEQETAEEIPEAAADDAPSDDTFYAIGLALSQGLAQFDFTEEELEQVQQGLEDGVLGNEPRVDVREYNQQIQSLAMERAQRAVRTERAEGAEFLADVAAAEGAEQTESGMVFESLEEGDGDSPAATDTVEVHYRGTLRDGTVFDSSYQRGQPARFPLNQVIPCWTEGVQKMRVGGKAKLVCPPDMAYGDQQAGQIPPGSTLIFEVELLDVVEAEVPAEEPDAAPGEEDGGAEEQGGS